jgi:hypothetical protein
MMPFWIRSLSAFLFLVGTALHAAPVPAVKTFPYKPVGSTILVPVEVAGSKPRWFILDTGANSCVFHKPFAAELGLKSLRPLTGSGAGAGPVQFDTYAKDIPFAIAGVKFACPHALGIDLGNQPAIIGHAVDGIIGTDLFEEYIVETDYELQVVRLHDKARFAYAGTGKRVPFTFDRRRPIVVARLTAGGRRRSGLCSSIQDRKVRSTTNGSARPQRSGTRRAGSGWGRRTAPHLAGWMRSRSDHSASPTCRESQAAFRWSGARFFSDSPSSTIGPGSR